MAKDTSAVDISAHLRPVLEATAKNLVHHLYGPEGLPWGTSFAQLEDLTLQLTRALGTQVLEPALQRQAQQPLPATAPSCPVCSRALAEKPPEPRSVHSCLGIADWQEPTSPCDHCRKAFFPSVQEPAPRSGR